MQTMQIKPPCQMLSVDMLNKFMQTLMVSEGLL